MKNFSDVVSSVLARFGVRAEDVLIEVGLNEADWEPLNWERYQSARHDPHLRGKHMPRPDVIITATPAADGRERKIFADWARLTPHSRALAIWEARDLIQVAANEAGLGAINWLHVR